MKDEKKNIKKKVAGIFLFSILIILFLFVNFVSSRPLSCIDDNPIALWHFDEGSGNTATDSCQGITGVIHGTDNTWINGKYGKSIFFNGYDTYVDIGSQVNQSFDEFSMMAWVREDDVNTDYQTFFGREIPYGDWVWNFALAKDSINNGYADASYFDIFNTDYGFQDVITTFNYPQYNLTDGNWHLLVGTFNGTEQNMSFYFDGNLVESIPSYLSSIPASPYYFFFGTSFNSAVNNYLYFLNGSLDEVAIFNRTLSQEEVSNIYGNVPANFNCYNQTNINQSLSVPTYPYVAVNQNYPLEYLTYANQQRNYIGNISIDIQEPDGNTSTFNFAWDFASLTYKLILQFTTIGNYYFSIYSSCPDINNFTGEFLVRQPYNITICGFNQKDGTAYINDFAYLTAEFTSSKKYYDTNLEQFITPLGFSTTFKTPVIHTTYRNGCGTLKMYEPNEEYALRLFDGVATFQETFSPPNITKTYGTNIFLGKYTFNGSDDSMRVLFSDKDIRPYFWLFNWIYIIVVIGSLIISVFLFFVIPDKPSLSLIFATIFIAGLTIIRIIIWFYIG